MQGAVVVVWKSPQVSSRVPTKAPGASTRTVRRPKSSGSGASTSHVVVVALFFQAEDGIRDYKVTGVQTCALPICLARSAAVVCGLIHVWMLAGCSTAASMRVEVEVYKGPLSVSLAVQIGELRGVKFGRA